MQLCIDVAQGVETVAADLLENNPLGGLGKFTGKRLDAASMEAAPRPAASCVKLKAAAPKTPLLVSLRVCPAQPSYTGSERNTRIYGRFGYEVGHSTGSIEETYKNT